MRGNLRLALFAAAVSLTGVSGLTGCGAALQGKREENQRVTEPELVLCYGEVNQEGHIMTESAKYFAGRVEELSGGRMVVEIYPSGQMGDDAQCYDAMKMGALDLYRGNSASLAECGELMISALALPYLFRDREHFWKVCKSDLGREILEDIQNHDTGMIGLAYLDEGARNFFTTDSPVRRLEDMKNRKIRMQISDLMEDTVSALGAKAVPISYAELYTALESGSVEGAENPPVSYYCNRFYEVAPYYVKDCHTYAPGVILASQVTWKNLTQEQRQVLLKAAELTQEYNKREIEQADEQAYKNLEWMGVEITEVEDPEAWREAMKPVYEKYGSRFWRVIQRVEAME